MVVLNAVGGTTTERLYRNMKVKANITVMNNLRNHEFSFCGAYIEIQDLNTHSALCHKSVRNNCFTMDLEFNLYKLSLSVLRTVISR